MSLFSTVHDIKPLTKDSKALDGQRLARVIFKTDSKGVKLAESQAVSIPKIDQKYINLEDAATIKRLIPHIVSLLENGQDTVIRAAFLAGKTSVSDSDISFDAVMTALDTVAASDRLTKESLETWFNSVVADNLTVLVADKLKIGDIPSELEKKKIEQMLARYRDGISALSGSKTCHPVPFATSILKVLEDCAPADDAIMIRLKPKLEKMIAGSDMDDLL